MSRMQMALLGSGEFDPWSEPVERWLLERSSNPDGPVLILPTASAHEGDATFDSWGNKGMEHYREMGVASEVVPLKVREDAYRPEIVERLSRASLVFFSGGNPARLTEVVIDTPFWTALLTSMAEGLPYAGCSAGVACLTEVTFDSDTQDMEKVWAPGLGYVRNTLFGPHWDMLDTWIPGATQFIVGSVKPGQVFVALDEDTAMTGDGRSWLVMGRSGIHVLREAEWTHYVPGDSFELELRIAD